MATRKKAEPAKEATTEQPKEAAGEEILQKAAKAIGSALGTMAVKTGIAHAEPTPPRKKIPKLVKKNKSRLPRKEKKLAKKKQQGR
jgi:hypothetical protein